MRQSKSCLALLLLLPLPVLAAEIPRDAALGSEGEVYLAKSARCRDLFADCGAAAANPLLAIEIQRPGQALQRVRVPGTAGAELEGTPAVLFQDASASLFVVWETRASSLVSRLNLAWLNAGVWSEVFEISGNIAPLKGVPQLALTHDRFEVPDDLLLSWNSFGRTTLHVAWWEQVAVGREEVFYTPVFIENGAYVGRNEVYPLGTLDTSTPPERAAGLSPDLSRLVRVEPGRVSDTVVIAFVNSATERLVTFEAQVLRGELSFLADSLRDEIVTQGSFFNEGGIQHLAEHARGHMVEFGVRLHPGLLNTLATEVEARILSIGTSAPNLQSLADRARGHMVEFGSRMFGMGGLSPEDGAGDFVEVRATAEAAEVANSGIPHQVSIRQVTSWPVPAVGAGPIWLFVSEEGKRAIVGWVEGSALRYRETLEEGLGDWSPVRRIILTGNLDAARAQDLLRRRVRDH